MRPRFVSFLLWSIAVALWVGDVFFPISNQVTRVAGVVLFALVWLGLIIVCWPFRAVRVALLLLTVLTGGFLAMPGREPQRAALAADYVKALRLYTGVHYVWGGESRLGIDCSGLVRRGLIDAMVWHGACTFNGGLIREAAQLWWHDTTAMALRDGENYLTSHMIDSRSLNLLGASELLRPGDLAATESGKHILAYLGDGHWIEADPAQEKVLEVELPTDNAWFDTPVRIVRWTILAQP